MNSISVQICSLLRINQFYCHFLSCPGFYSEKEKLTRTITWRILCSNVADWIFIWDNVALGFRQLSGFADSYYLWLCLTCACPKLALQSTIISRVPESKIQPLHPASISIFLLSFQFHLHFLSLYRLCFFFRLTKTIIYLSLSLLSLPLWVPSASLALSFHCNFILNSSHLALLRVCVYYSFFPSYPLNHHHHWFLAPSTTSTAIIGQGLKYASMCVLQNKTIFMTKH